MRDRLQPEKAKARKYPRRLRRGVLPSVRFWAIVYEGGVLPERLPAGKTRQGFLNEQHGHFCREDRNYQRIYSQVCFGNFLFGSYAYGRPTEKSDIVVIPDTISNISYLYGKIIGDLADKKIFFIDLLLSKESVFNLRKTQNILEKTIVQKGRMLYEDVIE